MKVITRIVGISCKGNPCKGCCVFLFYSSPLTAPPPEEVPSIQIAERFVSGVSFQ